MTVNTAYAKPELTRYGSFREITAAGFTGQTDGMTICGVPCDELPEQEQRS